MIDFNEEDLKVPYVSKYLVEYLEATFGTDALLDAGKYAQLDNSDQLIGYMKGVRDIIGRLRVISNKEA